MSEETKPLVVFHPSRVELTIFVCECLSILFFGLFTDYWEGAQAWGTKAQDAVYADYIAEKYALFQDIHVMVYVGFGFLMVFLKCHSWCSIGFSYLIAAWSFQLGILFFGFWKNICTYYIDNDFPFRKINLNIEMLIEADFAAATVLISFGAVLGKINLF
jgi:ammonium transporter Rh